MNEAPIAPDLASLQSDLAALRQEVGNLLQHLKTTAGNGAEAAAARIDGTSRRIYRSLATEGERSLKEITAQVEEQPLLALLIAAGIGYLGGRLLSR